MKNVSIIKTIDVGLNKDLEIIQSKNGLPVIKFNGLYLNSKYDPLKESAQFVDRHYKKNFTHVLFGLSNALSANALLEKMGENDFLLIIEPSIALFEMIKSNTLLKSLQNHNQVFFIVGYDEILVEEEVRYLVHSRNIGQIEFIISPNYEKFFPKQLNHLKEELIQHARLSLVNVATLIKHGHSWQKNLLNNLYNSWKSVPLKKYKNKFDCPVIIAASGPSLSKQLDTLKRVEENQSALIIAAGTTINPLLNAGVRPHIVVSIDGDIANWRHFEGVKYDDIPLFYAINVHENIPKHHNGLKVVFNTQDKDLSEWVNLIAGEEIGFVFGGASVATYSFDIAKTISTGPICLIGQDLAYTNYHSHAVGNKNTFTLTKEKIINNKNYIKLKGYHGDTVISDYSFLSMKKVFEDMILNLRCTGDKRPIFNCTEGGVLIEGIQNLLFEDFTKNYCGKSYSDAFNRAFQTIEKTISKDNIIASFSEEKKDLQELTKVLKKAIKIIEGVSMETEHTDQKVLNHLDKLDKQISNFSKSNIIHYLIMPLSFKINHIYQEPEKESSIERKQRIMRKSLELYKGLLNATESSLEVLNASQTDVGVK